MSPRADAWCERAEALALAGDVGAALEAARAALREAMGHPRALELIEVLEAYVEPSGWRIGEVVDGRYEVRGLLGRGGMGAVYRVHHREWDIELAVKTPLPAVYASEAGRMRFLREARSWIDLGVHPHVVQCWAVRELDGREGARAAWHEALAIDPKHPEALFDATVVAYRAGELTEEEATSRLETTREDPRGRIALAHFAFECGHCERVLELAVPVLEQGVRDARDWRLVADAALALGRFDDAERYYERALERTPDDAELVAWRDSARRRERLLEAANRLYTLPGGTPSVIGTLLAVEANGRIAFYELGDERKPSVLDIGAPYAVSPDERQLASVRSTPLGPALHVTDLATYRSRKVADIPARTTIRWLDADRCEVGATVFELRADAAVVRPAVTVSKPDLRIGDRRVVVREGELEVHSVARLPRWQPILVERGASVDEHVLRGRAYARELAAVRDAIGRGAIDEALRGVHDLRNMPERERDDAALALQAELGLVVPARSVRDLWRLRELPASAGLLDAGGRPIEPPPDRDFVDPPPLGEHHVACGQRFVLGRYTDSEARWLLWDRERLRYVATFDWQTDRVAAVTATGRFVIASIGSRPYIVDLVDGSRKQFPGVTGHFGDRVTATKDGRYVVVWSDSSRAYFELDWVLDRGGPVDPLERAFDGERPPIVEQLERWIARAEAASRLEELAVLARNYPRCELALAKLAPAHRATSWTRRLLANPTLAADPDAWAQLASAALDAGALDDAADAAAEGLARDGDHAKLHELLERARGTIPTLRATHSWQAHEPGDAVVAFAGDTLISGGGTEVRIWRRDGGLERVIDVRSLVACLTAHERRIVVGAYDGYVIVIDRDTGATGPTFLTDAARSAAQKQMGFDAAMAWGIGGGGPDEAFEAAMAPSHLPVRSVAILDGDVIASLGDDERLTFWSVTSRSKLGHHDCRGTRLTARGPDVIVDDKTRWTAAGKSEALDAVWQPPAPIVARATRGELVVAIHADDTLRWWRGTRQLAAGRQVGATAIAIADDGIVAVTTRDGRVALWPSL